MAWNFGPDGKPYGVHVGKEGGAWAAKYSNQAILESFPVKEFGFDFPAFPVFFDVINEEISHGAFMPGGPVDSAKLLKE